MDEYNNHNEKKKKKQKYLYQQEYRYENIYYVYDQYFLLCKENH